MSNVYILPNRRGVSILRSVDDPLVRVECIRGEWGLFR